MTSDLIGRKKEISILQNALISEEAEMISIVGRRRVGKTFLINSVYAEQMIFKVTGIQNAEGNEQLRNFAQQLKIYFKMAIIPAIPKDWLDAFFILIECLKQQPKSKKTVIFFDEVPWLATHRSGFLRALSYFWNSWAVEQKIVVVVCGSAASWMVQKIVRNKGGLHNRITRRIKLYPFNLSETETYLKNRHIKFDRYQLAQIYMVMGGIPHYLKELQNGESVEQNIGQICFSENGLLREEFDSLYPALFDKSENHIEIIRALGSKWSGMTRTEIVKNTSLSNGGGLTRILDELEQSSFITSYFPFGKKRTGLIYRLTDEYSLFYLHFIENKRIRGAETWQKLNQTQTYKIWRGYSFENLALKHISQIKHALQIAGIYSEASAYYRAAKDGEAGVQIDLLIDRNDHAINICEIKFYNEEFIVNKAYAEELRKKVNRFRRVTKTKKQLILTLLTTFGMQRNSHGVGVVDKVLNLDAFFYKI